MIIEGLVIGAIAKTFYDINKSSELDEKAIKKYAKAFEKKEEAELLVKKKAELADKRVANVAKKKRAIIQNTVPRFVEVYSQIQKVEIDTSDKLQMVKFSNSISKIGTLQNVELSYKKDFTDKELICGLLVKGIGGMAVKESERYLSAASGQMRASNVVYSQAESIADVYDAIIGRADRISDLLMKMNALFTSSINETNKTIERNGLDVRRYSEYDKGILMTCVNIAAAMSDIIDVPVVNAEGKLCDAALDMLETGEKYLIEMQKIISVGV